jgi:hypothetical protein
MAKQQLDDIFKKTEGKSTTKPEKSVEVPTGGRTIPVGVGLKEAEVAELDKIVDSLDITRNALMRYAIRYFLSQYSAGEIKLDVEEPEVKKKLKMP